MMLGRGLRRWRTGGFGWHVSAEFRGSQSFGGVILTPPSVRRADVRGRGLD